MCLWQQIFTSILIITQEKEGGNVDGHWFERIMCFLNLWPFHSTNCAYITVTMTTMAGSLLTKPNQDQEWEQSLIGRTTSSPSEESSHQIQTVFFIFDVFWFFIFQLECLTCHFGLSAFCVCFYIVYIFTTFLKTENNNCNGSQYVEHQCIISLNLTKMLL